MKSGTLLVIVLACAALGVWLAAQPSCEDQGGHRVKDGTRLMAVGKVWVPTPKYRCEVKR